VRSLAHRWRGDLYEVLHCLQTDVGVGSTAPLTEYKTDFESENGFEKVLQLATKLTQVVIDQNY
jgi:hypothetical protein